jgi:hypothetical protein
VLTALIKYKHMPKEMSNKLSTEEIQSLLKIIDMAQIQGIESSKMIIKIVDKLTNMQTNEQQTEGAEPAGS